MNISILTTLLPGDLGAIVCLHGLLYAQEYGWDWTFEAYVAAGLAKSALDFDPSRDRIWLAELEGDLVGCIAIAHSSITDAQLRYYLVHPSVRERGLGKQLMNNALQFCRNVGYKHIFLWTTRDLTTAANVYLSVGFRKTEEKTHAIWGKIIMEEKYEMDL